LAPDDAALASVVLSQQANKLVVLLDNRAAEMPLKGGDPWQSVVLKPQDLLDSDGDPLASWKNGSVRQLEERSAAQTYTRRALETETRPCGKRPTGWKTLAWRSASIPQSAVVRAERSRRWHPALTFNRALWVMRDVL
jgi:hypothetical protein